MFMNLFYEEIFTTYSIHELSTVERLLKENNIPSKRKSVNRNFHRLSVRQPMQMLGPLGEDLSLETQYYHLYVPKGKQEDANDIIYQWRSGK